MRESHKHSYRGKQADICVRIALALIDQKQVKISDLAEELAISYRTAYRWVVSFSLVLPITITRGIVQLQKTPSNQV